MALIERKRFVGFTTIGLFVFIFLAFYFRNDPRMADGVVTGTEMFWWEVILVPFALVAVFANLFASAAHAFKHGRAGWAWANILFWPISFFYTWRTFFKSRQQLSVITKLHV